MVRPQGALQVNTTGQANFAGGVSALQNNVTGSFNTALGYAGGYNLNGSESYDIDIGNYGVSGESGAIRIGTAGTDLHRRADPVHQRFCQLFHRDQLLYDHRHDQHQRG
jgi:hypothetical protein